MTDETVTTCIVCCDNGTTLRLEHTCGNWYVHEQCFRQWLSLHSNECIICRKRFRNNFKLINSNGYDRSDIIISKYSTHSFFGGIFTGFICVVFIGVIVFFGTLIILDCFGVFHV